MTAVEEMCERLKQLDAQYNSAPDEGARILTSLMMQGVLFEAKMLADRLASLNKALEQ